MEPITSKSIRVFNNFQSNPMPKSLQFKLTTVFNTQDIQISVFIQLQVNTKP